MTTTRGYKFDSDSLEERLTKLAEKVIDLCKKLPKNVINQRLIPQFIASAGSSYAHYGEVCEAESNVTFNIKYQ